VRAIKEAREILVEPNAREVPADPEILHRETFEFAESGVNLNVFTLGHEMFEGVRTPPHRACASNLMTTMTTGDR